MSRLSGIVKVLNTIDKNQSCSTMRLMASGIAVATLAPLILRLTPWGLHGPSALGTKGKEVMEFPDGPTVTKLVTVDFCAVQNHPLTHSQAIQRSNVTPAPVDRGCE